MWISSVCEREYLHKLGWSLFDTKSIQLDSKMVNQWHVTPIELRYLSSNFKFLLIIFVFHNFSVLMSKVLSWLKLNFSFVVFFFSFNFVTTQSHDYVLSWSVLTRSIDGNAEMENKIKFLLCFVSMCNQLGKYLLLFFLKNWKCHFSWQEKLEEMILFMIYCKVKSWTNHEECRYKCI